MIPEKDVRCRLGVLLVCAGLLGGPSAAHAEGGGIHVVVVAVLASEHSTAIDSKLKDLAAEVQKQKKEWTGFRLGAMTAKTLPVGSSADFPLVDKQTVSVGVEPAPDEQHVTLKVKPPELAGEITYTTVLGKYFPIVTPHQTKQGEHLIVAIMARTGKDK